MKKKIIAVFAAFIIAIPMLTFSAFGATPRWTFFNSATVFCVKDDDTYGATVTAGNDVTQLTLNVALYEKGLFTDYKKVDSISNTVYSHYYTISDVFSFSSLKSYKVELTATARTAAGQVEVITISDEY